jgi:beta-lactamase superfamily II metal-dependent hydrolase
LNWEKELMKKLPWLLALGITATGLATALPVRSAAPRPLDIFFVDTEGGAATLMVTPAGESILVDSGWPGENGRDAKRIEQVARYVAGLTQIDHYVTTHWHTDHYGSIETLAKLMPVKHFWDHGIPAATQDDSKDFPVLISAYKRASGGHSTRLKPGDTLPLRQAGEPLELKVVASEGKVIGEGDKEVPVSCSRHPEAPVKDESDNKRSVSLLLTSGKFGYLNCGDLTWNIEHKLVCPKNRLGQVDLWQVSHHGWEASGNPALPEAIKPSCAVMVNGARKGASPRTVRMLKQVPHMPFYQLHLAVTNKPDENAPLDHIANVEEKCKGEFIRAQVAPDGSHYTLYKGANQKWQTFDVR